MANITSANVDNVFVISDGDGSMTWSLPRVTVESIVEKDAIIRIGLSNGEEVSLDLVEILGNRLEAVVKRVFNKLTEDDSHGN